MFNLSRSFLRFMRPWPLFPASGASGGLIGLLIQVLREFSGDSAVLICPEPPIPVGLASGLDLDLDP